jgi:chromosome condensin MukBEF ATPase and DNA-binding subunit MukB
MAAFYFCKAGRDTYGEETFEFTHKSFGEFLAAKRIVKKIQQIHKKLREREKSFDEGWDVKECLTQWIKIFGPKELDWDLLKFISNEIKALYKKNKDELKAVQETVIQLMNYMLKNSMPMETIVSSQGTRYPYFIENIQAARSKNKG